MEKWNRFYYQPCLVLGENGTRVTGCKEHIELSRQAAAEGMVLLKNEKRVLPSARDRSWLFSGREPLIM